MRNSRFSTLEFVVTICWVLFGGNSIGLGEDGNASLQELLTKGLRLPNEQSIRLTAPTIRDGMTAEQQRMAIKSIAEQVGVERFMRESVNSPFVINIEPAGKLVDAQIQTIDIWYIAYGSIDDVENRKLLEEVGKSHKTKSDLPEKMREITAEELKSIEPKPNLPTDFRFSHLQFGLLEKVHLELVTRSQSSRSDKSLCIASKIDSDLAKELSLSCRWAPIEEANDGQSKLGKPVPYAWGAGYSKATQLIEPAKAILVEIHVAYVEPAGWFNGKNLLRSKLPPLVQDVVRTFRRKLSN
jgi:hypothetical protein